MTKKPIGTFNISDTPDPARNEDWIKTPANRASEAALHDELSRNHGAQPAPLDAGEDATE